LAIGKSTYEKRSIGTATRSGIAADVDVPIVRTGATNIIDVEDDI